MALQKWVAAPAGNPPASTLTILGSSTDNVFLDGTFANESDVAIGAQIRLFVHGVITTTGTPSLTWGIGHAGLQYEATAVDAPTDVTDQAWSVEFLATIRPDAVCAYFVREQGLTGAGTTLSADDGEVAQVPSAGNWDFSISWVTADDGDSVSIHSCCAEWIG